MDVKCSKDGCQFHCAISYTLEAQYTCYKWWQTSLKRLISAHKASPNGLPNLECQINLSPFEMQSDEISLTLPRCSSRYFPSGACILLQSAHDATSRPLSVGRPWLSLPPSAIPCRVTRLIVCAFGTAGEGSGFLFKLKIEWRASAEVCAAAIYETCCRRQPLYAKHASCRDILGFGLC